ncbi:hypothetical protein RIR_jg31979.t1 [Rhizophagus irregularis DAOM 181602=DAOM 197198]|nr:hypothetical protein RIR_jg31979.t1 [Rhizophagus irregularis DAOM 181602=DAOM 197198]
MKKEQELPDLKILLEIIKQKCKRYQPQFSKKITIGLLFGIYRDAMQVILHALYDQSLDYDMRNDICIMED